MALSAADQYWNRVSSYNANRVVLTPHERAERTFRDALTREQLEQHLERGWIEVKGARYRWRIYTTCNFRGSENSANVALHWRKKDGFRCWYCAHSRGVPKPDEWLAQKHMIESNEDEWLRVARGWGNKSLIPALPRWWKV